MRQKSLGLTLIEVLIALAIVSIAMTAVIKGTSQTIRGTDHVQNKMMALWVAKLVVNESKTNLLKFSSPQNLLEQSTMQLGKEWFWRAEKKPTPNRHINKILVSIFSTEQDREDDNPVLSVESYVYQGSPQLRTDNHVEDE